MFFSLLSPTTDSFWRYIKTWSPSLWTEDFETHISEPSYDNSSRFEDEFTINRAIAADIPAIQQFLFTYFGNPPNTPILDIPEQTLLADYKACISTIFYITKKADANKILATIRIKDIGRLLLQADKTSDIIQVIDCFCVHPAYKKKGLGRTLLQFLHNYTNKNNKPHVLFLKEGPSLSIFIPKLISNYYAYYAAPQNSPYISTSFSPERITELEYSVAYEYLKDYKSLNPNAFILVPDPTASTSNIKWYLYREKSVQYIACFQNTYQKMPGNMCEIGMCTGFFQIRGDPQMFHRDAWRYFVDKSGYKYIWTNAEWVKDFAGTLLKGWEYDGPFHYYSFQWFTKFATNGYYCLNT